MKSNLPLVILAVVLGFDWMFFVWGKPDHYRRSNSKVRRKNHL